MKGFLLPLYCFAILGPQLRGAVANETNTTDNQSTTTVGEPSFTSFTPGSSSPAPTTTTTTTPATNPTNKTTTTSKPVTSGSLDFLFRSECRPLTLVVGGLILACAILLISTLMLACKVCRLSRRWRLRMLNGNFNLAGSSENCTVIAKQAASTAEAKETTVLLSDMGRTQEDLANGAPKEEEGGQAKEGEPAAEGNEKAAGGEDAPTGENKQEEPVAAASQPREDVTSSQSDVAAASSSEEPKDVV